MQTETQTVSAVLFYVFALMSAIALIAGILRTKCAGNEMEAGYYPVDRLGQVLLGDFLVPFELASVLLLVVMIGAAYLAKGRRRESDADASHVVASEAARIAREW